MPHIYKLLGPELSELLQANLAVERVLATQDRGAGCEQADFQNEKGLE